MCGRYVSPDEAVVERMWHIGRDSSNPFAGLTPFGRRCNVTPTTKVAVIQRDRDKEQLVLTEARWGLIPHWWKEKTPPRFTINSRSEEAQTKPMWRGPYRKWRCLIPAEGWYEWPEKAGIDSTTGEITEVGQPHFIFKEDRQPFCFAGLMSLWTPPTSEASILSCAILTQAAAPSVAPVHDRMPVILPEALFERWTDPALSDADQVSAMIREHAQLEFDHHAVSKRINSGKVDGEELIAPLRNEPSV